MIIKTKLEKKANSLIKNTNWYNNEIFLGCKKFWNHKTFDLDVINLGSSASYYAFDYSGINLKCANFALTSQYLLADYEILRNYSCFLRKGATVVLGACLFSLDGYDVTYFDDRYYTFLYPASIYHFSMQRLKLVKDMKDNPIKYYPLMSLFNSIIKKIRRKKIQHINEEYFEADAKRWMDGCWKKQFNIDNLDNPLTLRNKDLADQAIDIMCKIKSFCDEKGYQFVIVLPPVTFEMRTWLTPTMRDNYVYIFRNSKRLKGTRFLDYLDSMDFQNHDLYRNSYFLNEKGARLFTNVVLRDLNLI